MSQDTTGGDAPKPEPQGAPSGAVDKPLEGPGSEARAYELKRRFKESQPRRGLTGQQFALGLFFFLMILMFGAGRYVIAALAPKPPPGAEAPPSPPSPPR